ncbi:MAG: intradiol ring-cleavage dioxygenase [Burkholderiaceae bacterium]
MDPLPHSLERNARDPLAAPAGLSRRTLIRRWGGAAWAVPAARLLGGCAGGSSASSPLASAAAAQAAGANWATGGTARIGAAVRAGNPFLGAAATTCHLTCEATIGPCHTLSPERSDISDGWDGLPMHMQLRIVDTQCRLIEGAIVEVWHTNHTGGYSGRIVQMCNNDEADLDRQFFRGWQRTGKDGIVRFDSCYPGWYSSRANHVHLRVMKGGYDPSDSATAWITTQLLFADELNTAIFGSAPLYRDKGQPDTTLATDNVVGQEPDKSPYLFDVRNVGGVMLASKTLAIRSSLDEAVCRARGARPPRRNGGPEGPDGRGLFPGAGKPGSPS